ncbi:nitroreductase family protein [Lacrimispora celerecrescens]|uniref:Nitroreductase n=1 Tax=[Clostridium] celerecrescens 18A TaxID=1286362 RepID=A0A2M8Z5I1_9FIRM|nr:nitroreductase family protein [Lacrimispora celerecrescens]PJJ28689.1 nitroreductase [[Clostridium] celerecrescens 18A]
MLKSISNRRSIRKFKATSIPKEMVEEILNAGRLAPSSKNRQPWKFTVVSGQSKNEMLLSMEQGLLRERGGLSLLPNSKQHLAAAEYTLEIMKQAPITVFVTNPLGIELSDRLNQEDRIYEICNAQSIGAAMENMTLTATELGLGSLWICDIYFAYEELSRWLSTEGTLVAAMSFGHPDECPRPRPRKSMEDIVEWRM